MAAGPRRVDEHALGRCVVRGCECAGAAAVVGGREGGRAEGRSKGAFFSFRRAAPGPCFVVFDVNRRTRRRFLCGIACGIARSRFAAPARALALTCHLSRVQNAQLGGFVGPPGGGHLAPAWWFGGLGVAATDGGRGAVAHELADVVRGHLKLTLGPLQARPECGGQF